MKYFKFLCWVGIVILTLSLPYESKSQKLFNSDKYGKTHEKIRPYLNAGYVTNLKRGCTECSKDSGGAVKLGILTKGRFGFNAGYMWYNVEYNQPTDYDDSGSAMLLGLDFLLNNVLNFQWYLQAGIAFEKFESIYQNSNRIDTERSVMPYFGFLFNIKKFNTYIGMKPPHVNVGVGYTF
ncbi:hypothetical protein ACFLU5_16975 [Bacteroidota bacterium]